MKRRFGSCGALDDRVGHGIKKLCVVEGRNAENFRPSGQLRQQAHEARNSDLRRGVGGQDMVYSWKFKRLGTSVSSKNDISAMPYGSRTYLRK